MSSLLIQLLTTFLEESLFVSVGEPRAHHVGADVMQVLTVFVFDVLSFDVLGHENAFEATKDMAVAEALMKELSLQCLLLLMLALVSK